MNSAQLKEDLGVICEYLAHRVVRLEGKLLDACRRTDEPGAMGLVTELLYATHVRRVCETAAGQVTADPNVPTYMLSSLTVQEACSVLTNTADEDLRFATGFAVAPMTYAVTRLLSFELKRKSAVAAEGEPQAVARLLIGLHNADHKLFMTWHSHPGSGAESTHPSRTDADFHRRLEAGNYPVIGGIVNRDGYVRFFSYKRAFRVSVYGKGVEVIDEQSCVYKLNPIGSV